jgi:hypothetical protein
VTFSLLVDYEWCGSKIIFLRRELLRIFKKITYTTLKNKRHTSSVLQLKSKSLLKKSQKKKKIWWKYFLTPGISHAVTGSSGGLGTSIKKFSSRTIGSWLYCSRFGIWSKGRQYFDDAGICVQQIKNVKLKGLSRYLTRKLQRIIDTLYQKRKSICWSARLTGITVYTSKKNCN